MWRRGTTSHRNEAGAGRGAGRAGKAGAHRGTDLIRGIKLPALPVLTLKLTLTHKVLEPPSFGRRRRDRAERGEGTWRRPRPGAVCRGTTTIRPSSRPATSTTTATHSQQSHRTVPRTTPLDGHRRHYRRHRPQPPVISSRRKDDPAHPPHPAHSATRLSSGQRSEEWCFDFCRTTARLLATHKSSSHCKGDTPDMCSLGGGMRMTGKGRGSGVEVECVLRVGFFLKLILTLSLTPLPPGIRVGSCT